MIEYYSEEQQKKYGVLGIEKMCIRDRVYSDKSLYNEALEEAERRKSENMKKLYSYQILKS